jgi:hypothetical protein
MMKHPYSVVGAACALLACGGEAKQHQETGGASGSGGAAAGATSGMGGATSGMGGATSGMGGNDGSSCPDAPPSDGSPCSWSPPESAYNPRANCSYGDDPRPNCRTLAFCQQNAWKVTPPDASCGTPPLPSACPGTVPSAGSACSDTSLDCWYPDGTECACVACEGGSQWPICRSVDPPQWGCGTPPSGCPNPPPQAGTPCTDAGPTACGTTCEEPILCEGGAWVYEGERCPICASPDTPIATPEGERAIAELRPGDLVYSVERGATVAVPLLGVGSTPVTAHHVVRLVLDDGRVLELSAGHPTADGRRFGELVAGSKLDERHVVVSATLVPYRFERTYDVLPDSSSGTYFAAGALVGSSLRREPER